MKCLVDHGARLVARLADGRTALHLAAERGDIEIVKILMDKSNANEAEEEEKQARKRNAKQAGSVMTTSHEKDSTEEDESDLDVVSGADSDEEDQNSVATGSFVNVKKEDDNVTHEDTVPEDDEESPDFYDVNAVAWDTPCSALHFAIICGHDEVVKLLCQEYGADVLLPIKFHDQNNQPTGAILTLVLSTKLPIEKAKSMAKTILSLGASCAQADLQGFTAFQRFVDTNATELIEYLLNLDKIGVKNSINHIAHTDWDQTIWPLDSAIRNGDVRLILQLLDAGAAPHIEFETWLKSAKQHDSEGHGFCLLDQFDDNVKVFERDIEQPIVLAVRFSDPSVALELLKRGADVNTFTLITTHILQRGWFGNENGQTVLDLVREQLERLRKYKPYAATPPELKHGMDVVVGQFKEGTWQHAASRIDAASVKRDNDRKLEAYETENALIAAREGLQEQQAEIDSAIATLEEVEQVIVERGGKTFAQLHPDVGTRDTSLQQYMWQPPKESPEYSFKVSFYPATDLTEKRREKYIEL